MNEDPTASPMLPGQLLPATMHDDGRPLSPPEFDARPQAPEHGVEVHVTPASLEEAFAPPLAYASSAELRPHSGVAAKTSAAIMDFFVCYAAELHMDEDTAEKQARKLADEAFLRSTEDLFRLVDLQTFMHLPLPLHIRRWLYAERDGLLYDPLAGRLGTAEWHQTYFGPISLQSDVSAHCRSADFNRALQFRPQAAVKGDSDFPHVEVTVQVNAIACLDIQHIRFDADFTLMLDWLDVSVVGMTAEEIETGDIFNPEVVLDNAIGDDQPVAGGSARPRPQKMVSGKCADGHLKKTARYRVQLSCPQLDLRLFPFDTQILPIRFKARNHRRVRKDAKKATAAVILSGPEGLDGEHHQDGLRKEGHKVDKLADHLSEWTIDALMGIQPAKKGRYELHVVVVRNSGHVMWHVAFPTLNILLFAFSAYSLPIGQLADRLSITSTCLLAMMAFQGTIKEMLPPMPYLTAMGKYVIATFIVLTVHGIEHGLAYLATSGNSPLKARDNPLDYSFGIMTPWDVNSKGPIQGEAVWVVIEFSVLVILHVGAVWYMKYCRRQGMQLRRCAAEKPGVVIIQGPPAWGTCHDPQKDF